MNSIILSALSRFFFVLMLAVSLYVLYRGHNQPGGGFVGGLIAAAGTAILALSDGARAVRRMVRVEPMVLVGLGILAAVASGLPGLVLDGSFLTHQWLHSGDVHVGTTLVFDIGVYLVVFGAILGFVVRFMDAA